MCEACLSLVGDADVSAELPIKVQADLNIRERMARILTVSDGICPDTLVANTLDEEPLDGVLACGQQAHFSWRDRLMRADRMS